MTQIEKAKARAHNAACEQLSRLFQLQGLGETAANNRACRIVNDAGLETESVMRELVPQR